MACRGLLARLGESRREEDPLGDVLEHLRVLLNTRQGESETVPDFGVVDFTDLLHEVPNSLNALQQAIRTTILKYEPRLKNVVVRHVPGEDPLTLRFEIVGRLVADRKRHIRLQTHVNSSGRIDVE